MELAHGSPAPLRLGLLRLHTGSPQRERLSPGIWHFPSSSQRPRHPSLRIPPGPGAASSRGERSQRRGFPAPLPVRANRVHRCCL